MKTGAKVLPFCAKIAGGEGYQPSHHSAGVSCPMTCPTSDSSPTSVYRYYDASGVLIYVGITKTGIYRNQQHNASKEWWPFVASQSVDHFPTRSAAHAREVALIQQYRPPFNTHHNNEHVLLRAAYLAAREAGVFVPPQTQSTRPTTAKHGLLLNYLSFERQTNQYRWQTSPVQSAETDGLLYAKERRPQVLWKDQVIGHGTAVEKSGQIYIISARIKDAWRINPNQVSMMLLRNEFGVMVKTIHVGLAQRKVA